MKEKQLRRRIQIQAGQCDCSPTNDNKKKNNSGKTDKNKKRQKRKKKNVEEVKGVGGAQWRAGEQSGRERPGVVMETGSYQLTSCFPFSST